MKKLLSILSAAMLALPVFSQVAPYKYGVAGEDSKSRVAQLSYYPFEANDAVWLIYVIANSGTNIFLQPGTTNNVIVTQVSAAAAQTNILVFPNPTNSVGAVFNIVSPGTTTTILSNSVGPSLIGFSNMTNPPSGGVAIPNVYQLNTNRAVKVFTPNGTNWFVLEVKM